MPNVQIDPEAMVHHVPNLLVCKFRADPELILQCQKMGGSPYRGTPIGLVKDHWPFSLIKRQALEEAKTFIGHMASQGHIAKQNPDSMELWGPFKDKPTRGGLVNIEAGNPYEPGGKWAFDSKGAWRPESRGPQTLRRDQILDSPDWKAGVAFLIRGRFESTVGHQEETTGIVLL